MRAMIRKGELSESQILRKWPHHVALPAEALRGAANSMPMYALAKELAGGPPPCHLRREERDYVVFCFARAEDAQAFAERFGGERLAPSGN
jgi:hypothetical protein